MLDNLLPSLARPAGDKPAARLGLRASRLPAPPDSTFYLNANGASARYQILRFSADGLAVPPRPVIGAHNNGGAVHVAWPSAFRLADGTVRVYGSRHDGGNWKDVCAWESADGVDFRLVGPVLNYTGNRDNDVSRARVYFARGCPRPFKMVYTDADVPLATEISLATSNDGLVWRRTGAVCRATESWEAAGITPSAVFEAPGGRWVLVYHAFETLRKGHAAIAFGPSPDGPFGDKAVIMSPIESVAKLTGVKRLANCGTIEGDGEIRMGEPYVLRSLAAQALEPVVPIAREGDTLYFDRPLCTDFGPEAELRHVGFRKVDASYLWETDEGWAGYWTGHSQFEADALSEYSFVADALSEYTFVATAPDLAGPWTVEPTGFAFLPWSLEGLRSTENPAPLRTVPCP